MKDKNDAAAPGTTDAGPQLGKAGIQHLIASFRKRVGRAIAYRSEVAEPKIEEFMTHAPHTIQRAQPLSEGQRMLRDFGVGHLPVLDGSELVGLLSQRDVLAAGGDPSATVGSVMSAAPYTVDPRSTLRLVAAEMSERRCGSAIVVDKKGQVIGIFTSVDALRALSLLLGLQRPVLP